MMKTLVAYTMNIDDGEAAVAEILEQLDLEHRLLKNSVGILICHLDFMEEGIVKALCERLPFEVAGINSLLSSAAGEADPLFMVLTVLTSDNVSFAAGLSEPLGKGDEGRIGELFTETAGRLPGKPSLILSFSPLLIELGGGDILVNSLDAASGRVPIFGALAVDFTTAVRDPRLIFNGETWKDRLGIILLSGDFEVRFSVASLAGNQAVWQKAIVTKSRGTVVSEVNDLPVGVYLESLGLAENGRISATDAAQLPLLVDLDSSSEPVVRSILGQLEDGSLIMGGDIPQGCSIRIGSISNEDVRTTALASTQALAGDNQDGILLFSCLARNFPLGLDTTAEANAVREGLGPDRVYMFAYTGGEICPVKTYSGTLKNRFHNASLISCSFK